jgi:hypothetical protein
MINKTLVLLLVLKFAQPHAGIVDEKLNRPVTNVGGT